MDRLKRAFVSGMGLVLAAAFGMGIYSLIQTNWTWAFIWTGSATWGAVDAWREARVVEASRSQHLG